MVRVPLPIAVGTVTALVLTPETSGAAVPGDSRVLNFRVLACACEAAERPLPPAQLIQRPEWTAVTVNERPAAIDWPARLEHYRRELAEMGRPAYLHPEASDFVLMHREHWHELRGYPESHDRPERLAILFAYSARYAGITEEVLRQPLVVGGPPRPDPGAPDPELVWLITQMRRMHAPAILNLDTWGRNAH
jgi:hypothetical protein